MSDTAAITPEEQPPEYFKLRLDQYRAMHQLAIIPLHHDVELWGGLLYKKIAISEAGRPLLQRLEVALRAGLPPGFTLCVNRPVVIGEVVPHPDFCIIPMPSVPPERVIQQEAISLVIELAETAEFANESDRRAYIGGVGVPEYWLINAPERRIDRYWNPRIDGFLELTSYGVNEQIPVMLNAQRTAEIAVATIFSPETTTPVTT